MLNFEYHIEKDLETAEYRGLKIEVRRDTSSDWASSESESFYFDVVDGNGKLVDGFYGYEGVDHNKSGLVTDAVNFINDHIEYTEVL